MKIVEVESLPVRLAARASYLGAPPDTAVAGRYFTRQNWRSLYSADFESLLVRIVTDEGLVGWGEALAPVGPQIPAEAVRRLIAPVLIGEDPTRVRPLWRRMSDLMRERGHLVGHQADALAAVDTALWDLWGKAAGQSVAALLGGAFRTELPCYVSGLPAPDDDGRVELMRGWADQGVTSVKLHLGNGVANDLATVDAVAAVHPDLRIAVDAHWVYRGWDALRLGRGLDERGVWFYEAPLVPEDIAGSRELAAAVTTPVAIGEALRNRYEFGQWVTARALDIAQPDIGRTGITEAAAIAELCSASHIPVAPHHSTGLGIALAAGIQVAAAVDDLLTFEFQPDTFTVANRILRTPLERTASGLPVPSGPGLGVEVDEDVVRAAVIA